MVRIAQQKIFGRWLLALACACVYSFPAAGDEKIEVTGERKLELPKTDQKRSTLPSFDVNVEKPDFGGGLIMPPTSAGGVPLDRKTREALDKKEHWMFVNPYEMDKSVSGLDKFETEDKPALFKDEQDEKTVMERYLQEKDRRQQSDLLRSRDRQREPRENLRDNSRESPGLIFQQKPDWRDADDVEFSRELSLRSFLSPNEIKNPGEMKNAVKPGGFSLGALGAGATPDQKRDLQKQEDMRAAEFQRFLQPRNLTPSIAGLVDPIGAQADTTRQAANPIAPRHNDQMNFGRTESASSSRFAASKAGPELKKPIQTEGYTIHVPRAGLTASSFTTPAPNAPTTPAFSGSPFSLPVPQRKF